MSTSEEKGRVERHLEDKRAPLLMLLWIPVLAAVLFGGLLLVVWISMQI